LTLNNKAGITAGLIVLMKALLIDMEEIFFQMIDVLLFTTVLQKLNQGTIRIHAVIDCGVFFLGKQKSKNETNTS
jgi:hypothetical protein